MGPATCAARPRPKHAQLAYATLLRADPSVLRAASARPQPARERAPKKLPCLSKQLTSRSHRPCTGAGKAPTFDLATALTRKETRVIRKAEGMVQYNLARCPNYGVFESPEYARAEELKEKIAAIEAKAKKRWESNFF